VTRGWTAVRPAGTIKYTKPAPDWYQSGAAIFVFGGREMIEELKQKLGAEVEKLQHELNVTLPAEIRKAVEHGDLRENSEYKAALERQQFVQARLGQLRSRLSKLSSIDMSQIPPDKVGLGSRVVVQDEKTRERGNTISSSVMRSNSRKAMSPWRRRSDARFSGSRSAKRSSSSCPPARDA
jgi:hypothetical protein